MGQQIEIEVHKYGGMVNATPERILANAAAIRDTIRETRKRLVIVMSAMGKTTDELLREIHTIDPGPSSADPTEDLYVSTGETKAVAMIWRALRKAFRKAGLDEQNIVGLPAHMIPMQAAAGSTKSLIQEVDGRGGSDTTAVALAAALQKELGYEVPAFFEKEAPGVLAVDPSLVENPKALPFLDYSQCLHLLQRSSKEFIARRAAEIAQRLRVKMIFRAAPGFEKEPYVGFPGTVISARRSDEIEENDDQPFTALATRKYDCVEFPDISRTPKILNTLEEKRVPYEDIKPNPNGGYRLYFHQLDPQTDGELNRIREETLRSLRLWPVTNMAVLRLIDSRILAAEGHITNVVRRSLGDDSLGTYTLDTGDNSIDIHTSMDNLKPFAEMLAETFELKQK